MAPLVILMLRAVGSPGACCAYLRRRRACEVLPPLLDNQRGKMKDKIYDPKKLTKELQDAKLPVSGVSSSGRIDFSRELTKAERIKADEIINMHDPDSSNDNSQ